MVIPSADDSLANPSALAGRLPDYINKQLQRLFACVCNVTMHNLCHFTRAKYGDPVRNLVHSLSVRYQTST